MIVLVNLLDPEGWGTTAVDGWSIFIYPWFFVSGFVIISNERLQESIMRMRWISLAASVITWPAIDILWEALGDPSFGTWRYGLGYALYCVRAWCWLLVVFGFGRFLFGMKLLTKAPTVQSGEMAETLPPA
jgi:hypothetical protein